MAWKFAYTRILPPSRLRARADANNEKKGKRKKVFFKADLDMKDRERMGEKRAEPERRTIHGRRERGLKAFKTAIKLLMALKSLSLSLHSLPLSLSSLISSCLPLSPSSGLS